MDTKSILDTVRLALIPLFGYAAVYLYEWGYCSYYNIPPQLISLDLATGLFASACLFAISFAYYPLIVSVFTLPNVTDDEFFIVRIPLFFCIPLTVVIGYYCNIVVLVLFTFLSSLNVVHLIAAHRKSSSTQQATTVATYRSIYSPITILGDALGKRAFMWTFIIVSLGMADFSFGSFLAPMQLQRQDGIRA